MAPDCYLLWGRSGSGYYPCVIDPGGPAFSLAFGRLGRCWRQGQACNTSDFSNAGCSAHVSYDYWPDGTVASESYYLTGDGQPRRVKRYAADAHRRPTFEGWV